MRLVTYDRGGARRLGALVADIVVDLPDAVGHPSFPTTLEALVAYHGGTTLDAATFALARPEALEACAVTEPRLLVPIIPTSLREFAAGGPSSNGHRRVLGPDEEMAWPGKARYLGCELEVACIVGGGGRKLSRARASDAIFGYTLMGDWSAWRAHRTNGSRPRALAASAFAISLGPCVLTPDEFDPDGVRLVARIDDEVWSEGALDVSGPSFPEIIAEVSRTEEVAPGEVYGSAAFGYGYRVDPGKALHRGARVDLVADGIGTLSTRIGLRG